MRKNDIIRRYSDAKEIYVLVRRKKMNKFEIIIDWIVALFTPLWGIVDDADTISDPGDYFLVVFDNTNKLVRVWRKDITEQELCVKCDGKKFVVNGNYFIKGKKIYG